jgi:GT2 family glycosyltransferase
VDVAAPTPAVDAPRPQVVGKFLEVGDRRLWIAGVTYGTLAPNDEGHQFGSAAAVDADFRAMAANGINAVRTYTTPPRWLLDAALRHGLWVMVGLPWEQHVTFLSDRGRGNSIEARVRAAVRACAGHPAVLCYTLGNEIPASIVRWHGRRRVERFLERLYQAAKQEDPEALVTYVSFPSTEYLALPFLDFLCFNVYLEQREQLAAYLARLQNLVGERPLVLAEVGLDSRRHGLEFQADAVEWQLATVFESGCAGAFVFAWTDEWHTGGSDVDDWDFGLTDRQRRPKPALDAARRVFAELPFPVAASWPRISVVVCTFNGSATLAECLDGLTRLDYPDYEVIVVDDGSTDASAEIAADRGVQVIRTENRGLSAARNSGLLAATGEIVAYIDDDAWPDPAWLKYLALGLRDGDHVGVGGPNLPVPDDGPVAEAVANAPGGPVHVLLTDTVAEHIPGCNMAFRREWLLAIGGFDAQFRVAGDDVDVCWRLQERGWTLGFHPAAMVWHHRRASLRGFWRQQRGYGRAEALLERKWPEKYNAPGHLTWTGRLYGRGSAPWRRSRIYYGVWGSGAFQPGLDQPQRQLVAFAGAPEWYLMIAALTAVSVLGTVARPLLAAAPLLAVAIGLLLTQAVSSALRCDVRAASRPRRLAVGGLTALLVLAQPAARLTGRLRNGLTPWRQTQLGFALPRPRIESSWHERWQPLAEHVGGLERALRADGARVRRGGACDRWELQACAGAVGGIRLQAVVEEHGQGRQLVRARVRPRPSGLAQAALGVLAAGVLAAASTGAWETTAVTTTALVALVTWVLLECGGATAAALAAVRATAISEPATATAEHIAATSEAAASTHERAAAASPAHALGMAQRPALERSLRPALEAEERVA